MTHKEFVRHTDGERVVLFIHGFLGSPKHFESFLELVPEEFGIYNVLLRGHGGTVRDFSKASMKIWKEQIDGIARELSQRYKEIIIVAHSMGTLFAYSLAVKYPQRIKGMLLLASPLKIGVRWAAYVNSFKALFGLISEDDPVGKAYADAHGVKLNLRLWEYLGWIPRYMELSRESKISRATIKDVKVPCYIFQSAKDELVSRKSERYIPKVGNIKLTVLTESAHFIYDKADMKLIRDRFIKIIQS